MPAGGSGEGSHPLLSWVVFTPGVHTYPPSVAFRAHGPGITPEPWSIRVVERAVGNAPSSVALTAPPSRLPSMSLHEGTAADVSHDSHSRQK